MLAAFYEMAFGSPDLGPVEFETFVRDSRPNTALACPKDFCKNAKVDFDPGIYAMSDEKLREQFTNFVLAQSDVCLFIVMRSRAFRHRIVMFSARA